MAAIGLGKTYSHSFSEGVHGRFVTLALRGSERFLTLCEVEVYGYLAPTGKDPDSLLSGSLQTARFF